MSVPRLVFPVLCLWAACATPPAPEEVETSGNPRVVDESSGSPSPTEPEALTAEEENRRYLALHSLRIVEDHARHGRHEEAERRLFELTRRDLEDDVVRAEIERIARLYDLRSGIHRVPRDEIMARLELQDEIERERVVDALERAQRAIDREDWDTAHRTLVEARRLMRIFEVEEPFATRASELARSLPAR